MFWQLLKIYFGHRVRLREAATRLPTPAAAMIMFRAFFENLNF